MAWISKTKIGLKPTDRVALVEMKDSTESWWDIFKFFDESDVPDDVENFFRAAIWFSKTFAPVMNEMARTENSGPQLYMAPIEIPAAAK